MNQKQTLTINKKIRELREKLDKKEVDALKLDLTERVAVHLDRFSPTCKTCMEGLAKLKTDLILLANSQSISDKDQLDHQGLVEDLSKHLREEHSMKQEGTGVAFGLAIGIGVGVILGIVFNSLPSGIAVGVAIGLTMGNRLDKQSKKNGTLI